MRSWRGTRALVAALVLSSVVVVHAAPSAAAGDVVYVAPGGDDSAPGTAARPVRTVTRAVQLAATGDAIEIASGRYHEEVQVYAKEVHLRAAPQATVVFDGSIPVSGWRAVSSVGGTVFEATWNTSFERTTAPYTSADRPEAGWPEQFFLDGVQLEQVTSRSAVRAGTFFHDPVAKLVVIGDDPMGRLVEGSDLNWGLYLNNADRSSVERITFQRYASLARNMGAVRAYADDVRLTSVAVLDNARIGVSAIGNRIELDGIVAVGNGHLGIHAHRSSQLTISDSVVERNNFERFDWSHSAGGIKVTETTGLIVERSRVAFNTGPGIWTDLDVIDVIVRGNLVDRNARSGIMLELSDRIIVVDNTVYGNGRGGIRVLESADVEIWHNSSLANVRDVWMQDGPRDDVNRVTIANNLLGGDGGSVSVPAIVYAEDWTGARSADDMEIVSDANRFWLVPGAITNAISRWSPWPVSPITSTTIEGHRSVTGGDATSDLVRSSSNPFARSATDARQAAGARVGLAMPPAVAGAANRPTAGAAAPAGPLNAPGWPTTTTIPPPVTTTTTVAPPVTATTVPSPVTTATVPATTVPRTTVPAQPRRPVELGRVLDSRNPQPASVNTVVVVTVPNQSAAAAQVVARDHLSEPAGGSTGESGHGWAAFAERIAALTAAAGDAE